MGRGEERADVVIREVTPMEAAATTKWRYQGPWSVYDGKVSHIVTAADGYHAIAERATDKFLGFVCLGAEARVPGLAEDADVLDVGIGLDPAIVGQGKGRSIVPCWSGPRPPTRRPNFAPSCKPGTSAL
jgi:ribosomal-protein-alanine N-acetyltransferase